MNILKRVLFDLIFYSLGASKEQLDHYHDHINPETRHNVSSKSEAGIRRDNTVSRGTPWRSNRAPCIGKPKTG